jgi:AcrR family transcriptional regulator
MTGRPRTVTDADILAATSRAISRIGPARLRLADVGTDAGVAPATLMQRFGSKRNLLLAFSAQASEGVERAFVSARETHSSPLAALIADPIGATRAFDSPEELANHLAFLQLELTDREFHQHTLAHARAVRQQIKQLLEAAVRARELAPCDTRRLAEAVHTTYNGTLITWAIVRRGRLATALRRQIEFVLGPYRSQSASSGASKRN